MKTMKRVASLASVLCVSMLFVACAEKDYSAPAKKAVDVYGLNGEVKGSSLTEDEKNKAINSIGLIALAEQREQMVKKSIKIATGTEADYTCVSQPKVDRTTMDIANNLLDNESAGELEALMEKQNISARAEMALDGLKLGLSEVVTCTTEDGKVEVMFPNRIMEMEYMKVANTASLNPLNKADTLESKASILDKLMPNMLTEVIVKGTKQNFTEEDVVIVSVKKEDEKSLIDSLRGGLEAEGRIYVYLASTAVLDAKAEAKKTAYLLSAENLRVADLEEKMTVAMSKIKATSKKSAGENDVAAIAASLTSEVLPVQKVKSIEADAQKAMDALNSELNKNVSQNIENKMDEALTKTLDSMDPVVDTNENLELNAKKLEEKKAIVPFSDDINGMSQGE